MGTILIGTIDCSFNNCGWSVTEYTRNNEAKFPEKRIKTSGIVQAKKIIENKTKLKTINDYRQAVIMQRQIINTFGREFDKEFISSNPDTRIIFGFEVQGGSQDARACTTLGIAKGITAAIENYLMDEAIIGEEAKDVCEVMPNDVKKLVTGGRKAGKEEIIEYVTKNFDINKNIKGNRTKYIIGHNQYTKGEFEHVADSLVISQIIANVLFNGGNI